MSQNLLNSQRRRKSRQKTQEKVTAVQPTRTEIERDYDRILFSTPTRRLADKTQVFPLEKNDSVRTRLTHSHEVSCLARSLGTTLAFNDDLFGESDTAKRDVPALLATIGLVHDMGNPPFGHQGESAISSWFKKNSQILHPLTEHQKSDFLNFEGNAQAFRLVTRLQYLSDDYGLNLTYATLSSMMKYTAASDELKKTKHCCMKKNGFFASEHPIAMEVMEQVGLDLGKRHPLAYIMEACDDIAYSVLDIEDAAKKGLISFSDLREELQLNAKKDIIIKSLIEQIDNERAFLITQHQDIKKLTANELDEACMQFFRVFAITRMVNSVRDIFISNKLDLLAGTFEKSLIEASTVDLLSKTLKEFAKENAYNSREVLKIELEGYNIVSGLMGIFWAAIRDRAEESNPSSKRKHPFSRFVYGQISANYRRIFEYPPTDMEDLPLRYRECQLLTDMISGMTDGYAVDLYQELTKMRADFQFNEGV